MSEGQSSNLFWNNEEHKGNKTHTKICNTILLCKANVLKYGKISKHILLETFYLKSVVKNWY